LKFIETALVAPLTGVFPMLNRSIAAAFAVLSLAPLPLMAQGQNCAPRDVVVDQLNSTYGEVFSGGGLQDGNAVFEIWISESDGTWTILMTRANGVSCIMAAGTDWLPALDSQQVRGEPA
jgi:hypothetical protein